MKKVSAMINYAGESVEFSGCPSCAFSNHEFKLPCGMAFENEQFTVSQDWELPIEGFFIVCPKARHVEQLSELSSKERFEMFELVNRTIEILKKHNVCKEFNIVLEEKKGVHLHVWVMPRHDWMIEKFGKVLANTKNIFDYAKQNLRTEQTFSKINKITKILQKELK